MQLRSSRFVPATLLLAAFASSAVACAPAGVEDEEASEDALKTRQVNGTDPVWVYGGELPQLERLTVFVSIKGHTARVVGDLPANAPSSFPDYAFVESLNGKRRLQVTYPIATVDTSHGAPNAAPGTYSNVVAFPYNPKGVGSDPNTPWGGFPYVEYDRARNIAFHGPITADGRDWKLLRGPVSHACNRMQGEHAVELAHLMGVDMNKTWTTSGQVSPNGARPGRVSIVVLPHGDYDKIADGQLAGKFVDVEYAPTGSPSISASKSSPASSKLFKTWNGNDHPDWICIADEARLGQAKPCAHLRPGGGAGNGGGAGSSSHRANAKVCNVAEDANVRDGSLGSVIGKARLGEAVERSGEKKTSSSGVVFERVWLFADPTTGAPEGMGWISKDLICAP